ncbi:hypothetical protein SCHPADRAFT_745971 [Schizopora paradoxa]|uniref:Uncharacterized protein n=1 Tax=Schizopora paradoxa TaxID=27342 RepID=A0A0H2R5K8_9AGAM|nr:hypothetical protein SCHPADRAFT_745971 [Schizopora paradoxa]
MSGQLHCANTTVSEFISIRNAKTCHSFFRFGSSEKPSMRGIRNVKQEREGVGIIFSAAVAQNSAESSDLHFLRHRRVAVKFFNPLPRGRQVSNFFLRSLNVPGWTKHGARRARLASDVSKCHCQLLPDRLRSTCTSASLHPTFRLRRHAHWLSISSIASSHFALTKVASADCRESGLERYKGE